MNKQPPTAVSGQPVTQSGLKIWQMAAFMVLGALITIVVILLWFSLFIGVPAKSVPLDLPPASGKSDVTARVSQEYVNREVANFLTANPISVLAVGQVSQAVVQFNADSTMNVTASIKALGRQLDLKVKDKVFVKNNKLALALAEDPKLDGFGLPLAALNGVIEQVNNSVATQLNGLVQSVGVARDCTTGKPVGRVPTLQTLNLDGGVLVAEFSVAISG